MAENETIIEYQKGDIIFSHSEDIEQVYVVLKGNVTSYAKYGTFSCGPGSILGLTDCYYGISMYTYVAENDVTVQCFSIKNIAEICKVCFYYKDTYAQFISAEQKHIMDLIRNYLTMVVKCRKKDPTYTLDTRIYKWELDKYNGMATIPTHIFESYYSQNFAVSTSFLIEAARFATVLNDASLEMSDYLDINIEYIPPVVKAPPKPVNEAPKPAPQEIEFLEEDVTNHLQDSLRNILNYSRMDSDDADDIFSLITRFKRLPDKLSQEESIRRIRKEICDVFYDLYYQVFMVSLDDDNIPTYVKMFLNFGYIDETLISTNNQITLFKLAQNIDETCNKNGVYTIYNWLKHIIWEEKQPSRNTFDQSYEEFIKEQSRTGKLSIPLADALKDSDMKLKFEISNMFSNANRMTFGRPSAFVPILLDENIFRPLNKSFTTADIVINTINYARAIDFSLFYRSVSYSNNRIGLVNEFVYKEVLPDVILMPTIGIRGAMWQEIDGRDRASAARFMLPIFCSVEIEPISYNVFGKYRWELCKRIQGAYWNNLSERSLTSEYYDYLQFYKKNRDLSDAAKEKLKSSLINCRNNFAEVFSKDYELWITHESKGISKLNRVSRVFMSKYCPFNSAIRDTLKLNPAYTDAFEISERQRAGQKKRYDLICKTLIAKGFDIPDEFKETISYFNK